MTLQQDGENGSAKTQRHRQQPESLAKPSEGEAAALEASGMGQAAVEETQAAFKGAQAASREWARWALGAYEANVRAWHALLGCRSIEAAISIQSTLAQEHVRLLAENGLRARKAALKTTFKRQTSKHDLSSTVL
jgi:hypothetical protein